MNVRYEWHTDSGCNNDYALWEDKYDSLTLGDAITFTSGAKGHKATANVKSFTLKPQNTNFVSSLNTNNYCGENNWQINELKNYTGKTCNSTTYDVENTTYYFIYRLSGNNLNMSSLQKFSYPDSVLTNITYVKQ